MTTEDIPAGPPTAPTFRSCWTISAPGRLTSSSSTRSTNRFYIGEVKYKGEILPGEQPAIMDRHLFDVVQRKLTDQWSHRNHAKTKSDHLLTGLLYDERFLNYRGAKRGITAAVA